MRLGQLARKFDITSQDIIAYTKSKGIEINNHPNSKLDDEVEKMVTDHFDILPEIEESEVEVETLIVEEPEAEKEADNVEEIVEVQDEIEATPTTVEEVSDKELDEIDNDLAANTETHEEAVLEITDSSTSTEEPVKEAIPEHIEDNRKVATVTELLDDESEALLAEVDIIKAPKVELEGLKVVGKIELPEPKKKEENEEDTEEVLSIDKRETRKRRNTDRKVLSEEEREKRRVRAKEKRKEKEEWEARKKKIISERKKKEQKEKFYKERLASEAAVEVSNPKKKKKKLVLEPESVEAELPKPKTVLGKFWRWLNT